MTPAKRPRTDSEPTQDGAGDSGTPPTIIDDEEWTEGDFEVTTSDNVRFRVQSRILFGASPVLGNAKAMVESNHTTLNKGSGSLQQPTSSITFLDPLFETADVFRDFLALVCKAQIRDGFWLARGHFLVAFLQKWECAVALSHFLSLVQLRALEPHVSPLRAFAVCATAKDVEACYNVLCFCNFGPYPSHPSSRLFLRAWDTHGTDDLDPAKWPLYMYPANYAWALARAYSSLRVLDEAPGEDFAEDFKKWLKKAERTWSTRGGCQVLHETWPDCPMWPDAA